TLAHVLFGNMPVAPPRWSNAPALYAAMSSLLFVTVIETFLIRSGLGPSLAHFLFYLLISGGFIFVGMFIPLYMFFFLPICAFRSSKERAKLCQEASLSLV